MSSMQKALKILSFLAIVGGLDLAVTAVVLATSPDTQVDALPLVVMGLVALLAVVLGVLGIGAANNPVRSAKLLPCIVAAVVANAADVVLAFQTGLGMVAVIINAAIVIACAVVAHLVHKQTLDRLG